MVQKIKTAVVMMVIGVLALCIWNPCAYAQEKAAISISVITEPTVREYCVGDTFNGRGLSLLVSYSDGDSKTITSGYTAIYDFSTPGSKNITIRYTEGAAPVETQLQTYVYNRPKLGTADVSVSYDAEFDIPVYITDNCGLMGLDLLVSYDAAAVTPVSVLNNGLFADVSLEDSISTSQSAEFHVVWSGTGARSADGILCTLHFKGNANADVEQTEIHITTVGANTYTELYSPIQTAATSAAVKLNSANRQGKKDRTDLAVSKADWVEGSTPSVLQVTGDLGNAQYTVSYAASIDGPYSETEPKTAGTYYVKVMVDETQEYNAASAIARYSIWKASDVSGNPGTTPGTTPGQTNPSQPSAGGDNKSQNTTNAQKDQPSTTDPVPNTESVNPSKIAKPVIKALKYKKKKVTLSLKKKLTGIEGYEIRYAAKKNMKNAKVITVKGGSKTKLTFKLSQKKKYYVQVRAYKKLGDNIQYSAWSKSKTIKVK